MAYYQFATDEEKRQEQLAALNKLRDQVLSAIGYPQASLELIVGELINFQRAIQTQFYNVLTCSISTCKNLL